MRNKLLSLSSRQETLGSNRHYLWPHFLGKDIYLVDLIRIIFSRSDCLLKPIWGEAFGASNKGMFRSLVNIKKKVVGGLVRRWLLLLDTLEGEFKRKLTLIFLISWGNSAGLFPLWCSEMRLQRSKTMIYGRGLRTRCVGLKKKKKSTVFRGLSW